MMKKKDNVKCYETCKRYKKVVNLKKCKKAKKKCQNKYGIKKKMVLYTS